MTDHAKTDPTGLLPVTDDDETPRDPRSPYEEMLEAAVINQRLADKYQAMLERQLTENARLTLEVGECKELLLNATKQLQQSSEQLRDASAHLQSAATTFLAEVKAIRDNCRNCNPDPERESPRLSVVP